MVWKIFFVITAFILLLFNVMGLTIDVSEMTTSEYLLGFLSVFVEVFVLGIFYSLGWKRQLFSKKTYNLFGILFLINMLVFLIEMGIGTYPDVYVEIQDGLLASIATVIGVIFVGAIFNIGLIPFYIGLVKYKKNFDNLISVEKPCWQLFAMICVISLLGFELSMLMQYANFASYNFIDMSLLVSSLYEILFLIGFAWNKKIFHKLFWQVTAIPYALITLAVPFFVSEAFIQDFPWINLLVTNKLMIVFAIVGTLLFFFILYQYAFKKEV